MLHNRPSFLQGQRSRMASTSTSSAQQQQPADQSPSPSPGTPSTKAAFGEGIDCFGNERLMLSEQEKFYNNPLLSDIVLIVGNDRYYAHKLLLIRASDVFERMFSSEWTDPEKKEMELVEEGACADVFPCFLKFLYSCHGVLTVDSALPLLVLADKYNVKHLQDVCITFAHQHIIPKIQLKDVFHTWFQYATKCYHQKLIGSSVETLSSKMDDIMLSVEWEPEWTNLAQDQLIEFLKSSNLRVQDEYKLWQGVVKWLQTSTHPDRMVKMETHLRAILPHVRFPMMKADQLCLIEKSQLYELYPLEFQPHLMRAFKFHSLSLASRSAMDEFSGEAFLLRNYTNLRWDKRLLLQNFPPDKKEDILTLPFATRSSSLPESQWAWEMKMNTKVHKSNYGVFPTEEMQYNCLLNSKEFTYDQARPVEYMLSAVNNERILATVIGKRNFSKSRQAVDTELDKKIPMKEFLAPDSPFLVDNSVVLQVTLKPVD